ncbi:universal stress protein [Lactococcus protaetiae]|uniref:Universal stress protein n=1 Tax=Lactococcus protaetiae TaxID=2592653 RepID=A0A514Z903_9LACT|nr:universal stress protein [Lactococcus protaetiae]MCL2112795.1 universal stress protein [Streptococcaceae bacterium]QDK71079.1 universal stress protein [Lactococcus protaetiae]
MKKQYKNILVAVDGSEQSYNAVGEATEIAKRNEAKLVILTVKDINRYYGMAGAGRIETPGLDRIAEDILAKAAKLVKNEVEVRTEEIAGNPKHRIVKFAEEEGVDLIVIGSTGAGFFDKLMLGSTTRYVVDNATCNVMIVR